MTILRKLAAFLLLLACAGSARAYNYPKPKNYRKTFKKKPAEPALDLGPGWTPAARQAIAKLVEVRGSSAAAYNENVPPVAVIGFDRLGADGDVSEAVFYRLVTEVEFKFSDDFWKQVPIGFGRQRLRADYEMFSTQPKKLWPTQPEYLDFRKRFLDGYQRICAETGVKECRGYLAALLFGFTADDARGYADRVLADEAKEKPRVELIGDSDTDPQPVRWKRGYALRPQISRLIAVLRENGFDVWVLGLDAQPLLLSEAVPAGVDASRCLGIDQHTERSRFNGRLKEPIPIRVGAIDALQAMVGRRPNFAIGSWAPFADLLLYADGLSIQVGKDAEMAKRLQGSPAVVQPLFKSKPAPDR